MIRSFLHFSEGKAELFCNFHPATKLGDNTFGGIRLFACLQRHHDNGIKSKVSVWLLIIRECLRLASHSGQSHLILGKSYYLLKISQYTY